MMRDRTGWTRGATGPQRLGNKTYPRLTEFTRKCAACNQPFSIYVTEKIAEGLADSNNFGLKNCETHRRGGVPVSPEDVETLRTKDRVMADELAGLYETVKELRERLAKYELQEAMSLTFPWK